MPSRCCDSTSRSGVDRDYLPEVGVRQANSTLTLLDHLDHWSARWGLRRDKHQVAPGLYALGDPKQDAPVFVTANYRLSFDALRHALNGISGYILVLDTHGINVWCAAGKGTFGTDELVQRIEITELATIVAHRWLILPQLGAPGVSAYEVKQRTGFTARYGPVRAQDLPAFLEKGYATPEMRRVHFKLRDRLALIPVELVHTIFPLIVAAALLYIINGPTYAVAAATAIIAGVVLFPILLPWLPTRDFSTKGLILGCLVTLPFAAVAFGNGVTWTQRGGALALLLALPPVTAYLSLNFTGSTTFTSKSGVAREMAEHIPGMAWLFGSGLIVWLLTTILRWLHAA